jgi:hypothetical protein
VLRSVLRPAVLRVDLRGEEQRVTAARALTKRATRRPVNRKSQIVVSKHSHTETPGKDFILTFGPAPVDSAGRSRQPATQGSCYAAALSAQQTRRQP